MVNKKDFAKRVKNLLDYYDLSASALADKIGVQRSSISHLLSGRNNPSLDFIIRIQEHFPEVSYDWLIKGIGEIENTASTVTTTHTPTLFDQDIAVPKTKKEASEKRKDLNIINSTEKRISKIVFFYSDGSFELYEGS